MSPPGNTIIASAQLFLLLPRYLLPELSEIMTATLWRFPCTEATCLADKIRRAWWTGLRGERPPRKNT
jgi:hypothetical protein